MDIRHEQRIKIVQELYSYSFLVPKSKILKKFDKKSLLIIKSKEILNKVILQFASKFPLEKIAKIDLAILQLAIYELVIEKKEPPKAVINEAVELAREFGADRSFAFINAILGKVYNENYELHSS